MLAESLAPVKLAPTDSLTQCDYQQSGCPNAEPACAVQEPGGPDVEAEGLRQEVVACLQTAVALL